MPAKVTEIVTRIKNLLGNETSLDDDEVLSLLQTRYEHLYETFGWSKRLKDFTINLVPIIIGDNSNTVTVTFGSKTVTSIGTPFTPEMQGRQVKIGFERQYFMLNYVNSSTITLQDGEGNDVTWPGPTGSGESWRVLQTIYAIPQGADQIISLCGTYPMQELDGGRPRLDDMDPDRITTNNHPNFWCYAGADRLFKAREIEVWPVPTQGRLLRGQFNRTAPMLTPTTVVDLPTPILVYSTAADACHLLHAKQGSTETMWENKALFFERKHEEVVKDFQVNELEMTSPPTSLARSLIDRRRQFRGTDYEVTHQLESP